MMKIKVNFTIDDWLYIACWIWLGIVPASLVIGFASNYLPEIALPFIGYAFGFILCLLMARTLK